jgi:peptidoglycan/xylan/chitin deacetylase (PgdA/CDA1 family)
MKGKLDVVSSSYFDDKKRLIPHGIMFHHFHHEGDRPYAKGSITSSEFQRIIEYIGLENILPADVWLKKAINSELCEKEVCITFDDSLKCQMEIAYPLLQKFGISAFWFVFSSVFNGNVNHLEIHKYFYNMYFSDFDEFYEVFKKYLIESQIDNWYKNNFEKFLKSNFLKEFDLYSEKEREFRFYRDIVFNDKEFNTIMEKILVEYNVDTNSISKNLWMNNLDLETLHSHNQIIGLHSFNHPTNMAELDIDKQYQEYMQNKKHILSVTNKPPLTVSHPCGSYNNSTLEILEQLKIKIGFRSNFHKINHNALEFPRVDHSHVLKELT